MHSKDADGMANSADPDQAAYWMTKKIPVFLLPISWHYFQFLAANFLLFTNFMIM